MTGLLGVPRFPGLLGDLDPRPPHVVGGQGLPSLPGKLNPVSLPARTPGIAAAPMSVLDRLKMGTGQVFAGVSDPNLSAAQNEEARKMAMIRAGLAMMAASGPSAEPVGLGQILAAGALEGQAAGQEARAGIAQGVQAKQEAAQRARMQEIIASGAGPDQLRRMFQQAVAMGDTESARAIATVVQAVEASQNRNQQQDAGTYMLRGTGINPQTGKPEEYLMDRRSGEVKWTGVQPVPPREVGSRGYNPDTDPVLQRAITMREMGLTSAPVGSEDERKAASFAGFIPEAVSYIDQFVGAPGRVEQAASDRGLREFTNAEQQQLQLSGAALAEAWLRMTTGAAYNEREFANAYEMFVPRPGDRKPTLEMKKRNRERLQAMLSTRAGRAKVPEAETPAPQPFVHGTHGVVNPYRP